MTSTNEAKAATAAKEGGEQVQQPEKRVRTTPPYIQTVCSQEMFDLHQQRRKELNETWSQYIIRGLELRLAQLAKREQWREQKRQGPKQKGSKRD